MNFAPVAISAYTATTAVGRGRGALLRCVAYAAQRIEAL